MEEPTLDRGADGADGVGVVIPGDVIARVDGGHRAGHGTFLHVPTHTIRACVYGNVSSSLDEEGVRTYSVETGREEAFTPLIGSVILGKVSKVNPRFATIDIVCAEGKALRDTYTGMINSKDVRATDVDKVELYNCFRPGDVVRAEVFSFGDSKSLYLTTARDEYGVVYATSVAGAPMIPISWNEMQCSKTRLIEERKVAKTDQLEDTTPEIANALASSSIS